MTQQSTKKPYRVTKQEGEKDGVYSFDLTVMEKAVARAISAATTLMTEP